MAAAKWTYTRAGTGARQLRGVVIEFAQCDALEAQSRDLSAPDGVKTQVGLRTMVRE